jgi:SAM-dependent methyltransferase
MGNGLRRCKQACTRLFARLALLSPRRAVRFLRSLSRRLDEITRLIHSESAARGAFEVRHSLELERSRGESDRELRELEQRLHAAIGSAVDSLTASGSANVEGVTSRIAELDHSLKSLHLGLAKLGADDAKLGADDAKLGQCAALLRYFRRKDYLRAIDEGRLAVPILQTEFPRAALYRPRKAAPGSANEPGRSAGFNHMLYQYFGGRDQLRVLDLGCGGGGYVRSLLDDGHFAVGLDGSDLHLLDQADEWSTISRHLLTCDITKPFRLREHSTDEPLRFDVITGWRVLEHIAPEGLHGLFGNIDRHLAPSGVVLLSIATALDWDPATGDVWNVTVKPRTWWEDRFAAYGFEVEDREPFTRGGWLACSGPPWAERDEHAGLDFGIALRRNASSGAFAEPAGGSRALVA